MGNGINIIPDALASKSESQSSLDQHLPSSPSLVLTKQRKSIFIWGTELQRGRDKGREVFHSLVHCPHGCNGQGWPGTSQEILTGLTFGFRAPNTWATVYCFPRCNGRELAEKQSSQDLNRHLNEMPVSRGSITWNTIMPVPILLSKSLNFCTVSHHHLSPWLPKSLSNYFL